MEKIYEGKTKTVFTNERGHLQIYFKDEVTGTGDEIDPGGNEVVGEVPDKGESSLTLTKYFFDILHEQGIPTHYIDASPKEGYMEVVQCQPLGLEVICRNKAYGSFLKRYSGLAEVKELEDLNYLVEVTVKDDDRGDPLINDEALLTLGILSEKDLQSLKNITKSVAKIIEQDLGNKGLQLIDLKLEFGKTDDNIVIIDEISGDTMRVMKDGKSLSQMELAELLLG